LSQNNVYTQEEGFSSSSFENFYTHFVQLTAQSGIRTSSKRESLLRALYSCESYLSAEEIYQVLHTEHHIRISLATIYKILTFFENLDVVSTVLTFPHKLKKYKLKRAVHHDHLLCLKCGTITRFYDATLEKIQEEILTTHHFKGTHHTLTLYGFCEKCQDE
jgi:Fur family transcriptional regulator, ferric uptake regulator